ncbi:Hint domain-containing protein [Roseibaca sp. Y0-43]|uniref:Hint domain-containing protein n=1 Tax=Roseibaca sp. Y0-43 TaxID=2816854 RepID=UPI001D0C3235|nr:Hint domain-containing protein [Roseibaca sp. Y0-43]MCC1480678.1 Hint domain-containing protein [Roseibaca sp. Y0-43]
MPEVIANGLLLLGEGAAVDSESLGEVYTCGCTDPTRELDSVVNGLVFDVPEGTAEGTINYGADVVVDGVTYELTEVYSFWGTYTFIDTETGELVEYSGQSVALTVTAADGSTLSYVRPSDDVIRDPDFPSDGFALTSVEIASEPFLAPAVTSGIDGEVKISLITDIELSCFVVGAYVDTSTGTVPVEHIRPGDYVLTRDNGYCEVRWVGRHVQTQASFAARPDLASVIVRQGALGAGLPLRDMRVSPWHRLLICGQRAELLFGEYEVLVPAVHLVGQPGIERETAPQTYIHLMFDEHQIIRADGAWSESFQPGVKTLAGMGDEQRAEIFALFPELAMKSGQDGYVAARLSLKEHEARALLGA